MLDNTLDFCPHCKSCELVIDRAAGDIVCTQCATVICDRMIDEEAEWRVYADDDRGVGSKNVRAERDSGNGIHGVMMFVGGSSTLRKALTRTHMENLYSKVETKKIENLGTLEALGGSLGLSACITARASKLLSSALEKRILVHHADKLPLVAAVLYIASRIEGFPLWIDYVAAVAQVSAKMIGQVLRAIQVELGIDTGRVLPELLVVRVGTMLHLGSAVIQTARRACEIITRDSVVMGQAPHVVAAATVFLAALAAGVAVDVARGLGVLRLSLERVEKAYASLRPHAESLLPREWFKVALAALPMSLKGSSARRRKETPVTVTMSSSPASTTTVKVNATEVETEPVTVTVTGSVAEAEGTHALTDGDVGSGSSNTPSSTPHTQLLGQVRGLGQGRLSAPMSVRSAKGATESLVNRKVVDGMDDSSGGKPVGERAGGRGRGAVLEARGGVGAVDGARTSRSTAASGGAAAVGAAGGVSVGVSGYSAPVCSVSLPVSSSSSVSSSASSPTTVDLQLVGPSYKRLKLAT